MMLMIVNVTVTVIGCDDKYNHEMIMLAVVVSDT